MDYKEKHIINLNPPTVLKTKKIVLYEYLTVLVLKNCEGPYVSSVLETLFLKSTHFLRNCFFIRLTQFFDKGAMFGNVELQSFLYEFLNSWAPLY